MRKIMLLTALIALCTQTFASNFVVTRDPWPNDQLISNFPGSANYGSFLVNYVGTSYRCFTGLEVTILAKKNGLPAPASAALLGNYDVNISFSGGGYMHCTAIPTGTGSYKILNVPFTIYPPDNWIRVQLNGTPIDGTDTLCDQVQLSVVALGIDSATVVRSDTVGGPFVYFDKVVNVQPTTLATYSIHSVPENSVPVGQLTLHTKLPVTQPVLALQLSGIVKGYLPVFKSGARIVDSLDNTLATYTGISSSLIGELLPFNVDPAFDQKVTVLNDLQDADAGDEMEVSGQLCALLPDGYKTITGPVYVCSNFSALSRKAVYEPPTGVRSIAAAAFQLYPNPATDGFTIEADGHSWALTLTDMFGRVVKKQSGKDATRIERGDLASGMYVASIKTDMQTYTRRIIFR